MNLSIKHSKPPQVLVVGAGPTGLTMAIQLLRHGLSVRLVDRLSSPEPVSKAFVNTILREKGNSAEFDTAHILYDRDGELHRRYGMGMPGAILIRPDGPYW